MARKYKLSSHSVSGHSRRDYAAELNPQQLAAVTAPPGAALVIAGAGSGKTRTLTYRVAYLLEQGVDPARILLLTFTNKAAREMITRVTALVDQDLPDLWGGTFHSVGNRILRQHAELLGYGRGFSIMDREDQEKLIGAVLDSMGLRGKDKEFPKPSMLAGLFSLVVNTGKDFLTIMDERQTPLYSMIEEIQAVHDGYEQRKLTVNAMDFDDLLVRVLDLFKAHPAIAERYQQQFKYVLVDEYQDTNKIQAEFVASVAKKHGNVMAVGDDAQAIYSWRGADSRNVLEFTNHYPGATLYKIETNYRSVPEILEAANEVIRCNTTQYEKKLVASRPAGEIKPVVVPLADSNQQAQFVAQRIGDLQEEGVALNEIAVLYRSHYHSMEMQMELTRRGVDYQITSGLRFFEQAHIKDVTAFLKFVVNPRDEVSFLRMVMLIEGIGEKSAARLWRVVSAKVQQAMSGKDGIVTDFLALLEDCKVPARSKDGWRQLGYTLEELVPHGVAEVPAEMIRSILEAMYYEYVDLKFLNAESRREDLNTFAEFSSQYEDAGAFLAELSLLTNVDNESTKAEMHREECVHLSSIHQAKGLEWKVVFVITVCENMFPTARANDSESAIEEERRLFYVAVTRAMDQLYLTWPMIRANARYGETMLEPSRFLNEIPEHCSEAWEVDPVY